MTATQIREGQFSDVMPDMSEAEYQALKQSIEEDGLRHPIEITSNGTILDGHHRYKACRELGIEPDTTVVRDATIEQAIRANFTRRNLSDGSKKDVVKDYLLEHWDGDRTQKDVAADLGVDPATVSRAKKELQEDGKELSRNSFTREEKRQQAREYTDENPEASPRQVAANIEADVSHPTVRKWMEEWADADDSGSEDETTDDSGEDAPHPDDLESVPEEEQTSEEERETALDSSTDSSGQEDSSSDGEATEDASDGEDEETADEATGVDEHPNTWAADLEAENEELKERIERLREGSKRQAARINEYREEALNAKMDAPDVDAVEQAKAHVDVALQAIPKTPIEEQPITQQDLNDRVSKVSLQLEDAQSKLEGQL